MRISLEIVTSFLAFLTFAASDKTILSRQSNHTDYKVGDTPLKTQWTDTVGTNPWPEYPRPRLQRSDWTNLNGVWRYRNETTNGSIANPPFGQALEEPVLVPFCLESALSGTQSVDMLGMLC
jgi:hypothetical protein